MNEQILVIGGDSRIGRAIERRSSYSVRSICRKVGAASNRFHVMDYCEVPAEVYAGCGVVINCAGSTLGNLQTLRQVNLEVPVAVARSAIASGVRQFVQISSFSIFGSARHIRRCQEPAPINAYGTSKLEAECALRELVQGTKMTLTIVRVPMLYCNARSKLTDLLRFWSRVRVLPVPGRDISRSMLHYDLAADFMLDLIKKRRGGEYMAADPEPFSYERVGQALMQEGLAAGYRVKVPALALKALRLASPRVFASLFEDSLLDLDANDLAKSGFSSRLYGDVTSMARQIRND